MKKLFGLVKGCLVVIGLLVVVALMFGGNSKSSSSDSAEEQAAEQTSEEKEEKASSKEEKSSSKKKKKNKEKKEEEAAKEEEPAPEVKSIYHVGDELKDGDVRIVYMASGEHIEDNQFLQPSDGKKYVFIKLAFINESSSDETVSFYSFDAYADGYAADMYYGGDEELSATLSAGRATSGSLYFEVPVDAQEIEVEYTPNMFFSDKIKFAYDGDVDSGYVLEANTDRTKGAIGVGESTEGKNVVITFLSAEPYTSDNMFVTPRDGYGFMSAELEFENTGDSDKSVSSLSFDCYADGIACDQTYIRDDDLSGSISPGRKIKGTVTFEVPNDASVVEVEYEDNVWTSHRIAFTMR